MHAACSCLLRIALVLLVVAGGGCATQEEFDRRAAAWIGRSEGDLVAALGVPTSVYMSEDGRRFIQFETRRVLPGDIYFANYARFPPGWRFGPGWGWGWGWGYGSFPPRVLACDLTFELRDGRVIGFSRRGNDCVAVPQTS